MLLSRALPPQFLLPTWNVQQLALTLQQRAHKSDEFNSKRKRSDRPPASSTSLFAELFPEEKAIRSEGVKKVDRLPTFAWKGLKETKAQDPEPARIEVDRTGTTRSIPPRKDHAPISQPAADTRGWRRDGARQRTNASVLVLNCAMNSLEESDFYRVNPRGDHIEGWTSGILGVIPGRDSQTLRPLDHYFILFSNEASARAYLDNTIRLHRLAKISTRWGSSGVAGFPLPPGFLKEGEEVEKVIKGFSLVPAYTRLSLRLVGKPYKPAMHRLLSDGGPAAIAGSKSKSADLVLLHSDAPIDRIDLRKAIKDDGRQRNLHWELAESENDIVPLESYQGAEEQLGDLDAGATRGPQRANRFVISFKDRHEARRFVREWHRRALPSNRPPRLGEEPAPIVNAEILW